MKTLMMNNRSHQEYKFQMLLDMMINGLTIAKADLLQVYKRNMNRAGMGNGHVRDSGMY